MTHAKSRPVALRMIVGAAAVLAALLAFVPAASAARNPISGGTTDLHLKQGFIKKLTNLGVGLAGVSTGQTSGNKISLPVTEGMFDPTNAQGHFTSPGGFQLVKGSRAVAITGVEVNTVHNFVRADDRRRPHAARHLRHADRRPRRLRRADQGRPADADPEGRHPHLEQTRAAGQPADQPAGDEQRVQHHHAFEPDHPRPERSDAGSLRRDAQKVRRKGRRRGQRDQTDRAGEKLESHQLHLPDHGRHRWQPTTPRARSRRPVASKSPRKAKPFRRR